jgi:hypothetical protein
MAHVATVMSRGATAISHGANPMSHDAGLMSHYACHPGQQKSDNRPLCKSGQVWPKSGPANSEESHRISVGKHWRNLDLVRRSK